MQPEKTKRQRVRAVLIDWGIRALILLGMAAFGWAVSDNVHAWVTGSVGGLLIHRFISDLVDAGEDRDAA